MTYLDANIFIFAAGSRSEIGEKARKFLENLQLGNERAFTSSLTFDEVVWKVSQIRSFNDALSAGDNLVGMPNLIFLDVNTTIISKSLDLMRLYKLYPRDAIHAASALNNNVYEIISEDKDFDNIKGLKRKSIKELRL
ncbi:type II toxin-antitoxin system VapC family toxin [Candidatus Woesearchaeota archaeon]|nr:type II toxin-antitoxin system VapC family toxin [Candidatus Woesearchaeota archaeon]